MLVCFQICHILYSETCDYFSAEIFDFLGFDILVAISTFQYKNLSADGEMLSIKLGLFCILYRLSDFNSFSRLKIDISNGYQSYAQ
jgi:hypothetical protein